MYKKFILQSIVFLLVSNVVVCYSEPRIIDEVLPAARHFKILNFNDGQRGSFSADVSEGIVTFFINYTAAEALVKHKPWIWDKELSAYTVGSAHEDSIKLFLFEESPDTSFADIWVWRAGRTNTLGYADDMYWGAGQLTNGQIGFVTADTVRPDKGRSSWSSRFLSTFAGEEVKRFYSREPEGSCADVKATGKWKDAQWNVEFSRELVTGNGDDLAFTRGGKYGVVIAVLNQETGLFSTSEKVSFSIQWTGSE